MKNLSYFFVICFIFTSCNKGKEPIFQEEPCPYIEDERIQPLLDCMNMPRPEDSYCYPCQEATSYREECCYCQAEDDAYFQIPISILEKMSTQAVIQALWEHPKFTYMIDWWSYQWALEKEFSNNNAYTELMKRPDAAVTLLERLVLVDCLRTKLVSALEIIMAQPIFLSQLNDEDKRRIVEITLQKIDFYNDYFNCDDCVFCYTNFILLGRTMLSAGYAPFIEAVNDDEELKYFLEGWKHCSDDNDIYKSLCDDHHVRPYTYPIETPSYIYPTIKNFSKNL